MLVEVTYRTGRQCCACESKMNKSGSVSIYLTFLIVPGGLLQDFLSIFRILSGNMYVSKDEWDHLEKKNC